MLTLQECYKILGVGPHASSQEVRQAYLRLVKQWHPDSQAQANQAHPAAQERFLQIQKAYEQIKNHQATVAESPVEPPPQTPPPRPSTPSTTVSADQRAEILYANASELGRQGLYRDAIAELSRAIRANPNYALAYKYRGHLRSLLGLDRQAEADLNKARVLESMGSSAASKSPADIEFMARNYSFSRWRSPFRSTVRYGRKRKVSGKLLWAFLGISGLLGLWVGANLLPREGPRSVPSSPIQLETPSVES